MNPTMATSNGSWPVSWWRAGFGIILDDLVAAFCTLLVIAMVRAW